MTGFVCLKVLCMQTCIYSLGAMKCLQFLKYLSDHYHLKLDLLREVTLPLLGMNYSFIQSNSNVPVGVHTHTHTFFLFFAGAREFRVSLYVTV